MSAVSYIHKEDVVHRDLKPSNILFCLKTGNIKLGDFGISRRKLDGSDDFLISSRLGTPLYMAPEMVTLVVIQ